MKFVAIDWGTSSFRAWLIEHDQICDFIETDQGVKNFSAGAHGAYLQKILSNWDEKFSFIISIGMIGSSIGMHETKFSELPIDIQGISSTLIKVPEFNPPLFIVPGVSKPGDVMRGEESQSLAAHLDSGLVILPGTHSKWVKIEKGKIVDFQTYLTGELFELLRNHSTLSKATESSTKITASKDFLEGLDADSTDISHNLFTIRANWLQGKPPETSREFLSGLLVGAEIKSAKQWCGANQAVVVASDSLAHLYSAALAHFGIKAELNDSQNLIQYFVDLAKEAEKKL